ncbi:MAG: L,D-transpeptidase family protein [Candidatus Heteroscillospira sp.]|jgi:hypothetical protein
MLRSVRGVAATAALLILIMGLSLSAAAADFPDVSGHWAEAELVSAAEKGWLAGFDDGTMRPDESINGAQAVTLLCRMLDARTVSGEAASVWYGESAARAEHLGLVRPGQDLTAPLTRREAFVMLAEAFQTAGAAEDFSCLASYSDAKALTGIEAAQIASLVNLGCVQGYNSSLSLGEPLSRAQFAALLSRLLSGGEIFPGGKISDWQGGTLWINCAPGSVRLDRVKADTVVIRSQGLSELRLNGCEIGTLVLAHDGDVSVNPRGAEKLRAGAGSGSVTLTGDAAALEIAASRSVSLRSGADVNTVLLSADGAELILNSRAKELTVTGKDNRIQLGGSVENALITGTGTVLEGRGTIRAGTLRATGCTLNDRIRELTDETDYGIYGVTAALENPEILPAGETLTISAALTGAPAGLECAAVWTVDGEEVSRDDVTLSGDDVFTLSHDYFYRRDMAPESKIGFSLTYTTRQGERQSVSADCIQQLENYPDDHVFPMDESRILALVTTEYTGDYTLAWAEAHDYEDFEKEIWVNAKGYSSESQYLIWINQSCQRVNIFEGSQGQWKLLRSCIVGCGAGANTPRGVFETTWNQPGWFTASYDVRPVVRFYGGGYAFHSRLYHPGTDQLSDPGIGYPISHGCIRMYDEDIQWIYDNVPSGTTVVSF